MTKRRRKISVAGKCLLCGRVRHKDKPVMKYWYIKNIRRHLVECSVCKVLYVADTKEDALRQMA